MRIGVILLPLSLCAAPALAQAAAPPTAAEPEAIQIPPQLTDPATVDRLAGAMQSLSQALLDMKVGGVEAALEGRKPTPRERNLTVRDLGRRSDPEFERHLQQRIAEARPRIEQSMKAFSQALPAITRDLADAQKSIERAIANMPDPNYPRR